MRKKAAWCDGTGATARKKIVRVTGDLVFQSNLVCSPTAPMEYAKPLPVIDVRRSPAGAWLMADLIKEACGDIAEKVEVVEPDPAMRMNALATPPTQVAQTLAIWSPQRRQADSTEKDRVWRIDRVLGRRLDVAAGELADTGMIHASIGQQDAGSPPASVLILVDENFGFRNTEEFSFLVGTEEIILQTVYPFGEGALWTELISNYADRLTVVLSATQLRNRHAAISEGLSWDRTLEDLDRELTRGDSRDDLGRANRVVISFMGSAAVVYDRRSGSLALNRFVYDPEHLDGSWHSRESGLIVGTTAILTSAIVRHLLDSEDFDLPTALGRALAATRLVHERGAGDVQTGVPTDEILRSFNPQQLARIGEKLHPSPGDWPAARFCCANFPPARATPPSITTPGEFTCNLLQALAGEGIEHIEATATDVVLHSLQKVLPAAPRARFGNFVTVDREEIERVNEIRRLIDAYRRNADDSQPLSLAVFGPPGSGKGFAIKELARDLFGRDPQTLEFNLSQFSQSDNQARREELRDAFDLIRDASVQGQIPLVFWDEFDSERLQWLQWFLAPMQDATFRAGGTEHPFGKAIFVFAGGTYANFGDFCHLDARDGDWQDFTTVKGPDFVSRLRGYLNVKGINQAGTDTSHLIRRAVLLRSILERCQKHLINPATKLASIGPEVIRAFLRVDEFRHGARSIEAIVRMSNLSNARYFGSNELPSRELLRLHVTDDFMDKVKEGERQEPIIKLLACCADGLAVESLTGRRLAQLTLANLHNLRYLVEPLAFRVERHNGASQARASLLPSDLAVLVDEAERMWLRDMRLHELPAWEKEKLRSTYEHHMRSLPDMLWTNGYALVKQGLGVEVASELDSTPDRFRLRHKNFAET